jgi:hypothetical protein
MGQNEEVVVSPLAFTMIAMHSLSYPSDQVHGILIGSLQGSTVKVTDALPVCHESPTKPLVESALAVSFSTLQDGSTIVGWYSVPELIGAGKPGAAELRIAAGLEAVVEKPILVTASKIALENLANADDPSGEEVLEAFGKDFGKQWKEKLVASIGSKESSAKVVQALIGEKCLYDLVDHWQVPSSREWPRTAGLQEKITKHL